MSYNCNVFLLDIVLDIGYACNCKGKGAQAPQTKGDRVREWEMEIHPSTTKGMVYVVAGNVTAMVYEADAVKWAVDFLAIDPVNTVRDYRNQ